MKKFILSSITLVSLFIIGCDTNVYQPILKNQDFILAKNSDSKVNHTTAVISGTTTPITETFTHSVVGNKLILKNTFAYGNPGEIASMGLSSFDISSSTITLTYKDSLGLNPLTVPGSMPPAPVKKGAEITSIFDITQVRMGNGKKLKVNIVYDFPNPNTNVLSLQPKSYTLPY